MNCRSTRGTLCHGQTNTRQISKYCDKCSPGNFYTDSGTRACKACPTGGSCDGGYVHGVVVEPGYYRLDETTDRIRECPGGVLACVGGTAELCGQGHSGPLCDVW